MKRETELEAIAEFVRTRGVEKLPPDTRTTAAEYVPINGRPIYGSGTREVNEQTDAHSSLQVPKRETLD